MWTCSKCGEAVEDSFEVCWSCGTSRDGAEDPSFESQREPEPPRDSSGEIPEGIILSTTPSLENRRVRRYLGVVCGEAIVGANVIRDIFASVTDIVGGRSHSYEESLSDARRIAMTEMANRARALGGDAVLSIDLDYESIRGSMLMVTCSGTAVELEPLPEAPAAR